MRKRIPAYTIYLVIQGSFGMFFTMMALVSAIYRVESAGLDPLQLVLVGTVLETTVFLFEIPTGIVADVYSRRLSVIIGYFFFKDYLSKKGWLASLGILGASTLLAVEGGVAGFKAAGLIGLACICWGIDNHLTALIDGISPAQSTFWKGSVAGSVNLILGLFLGSYQASALNTAAGLGLGALSYGLSIMLYITSAQNLGATRSQLLFSSAPFFGLAISLFLGGSLSLFQAAAFFLFLGSVFVLFQESHAHTHAHLPSIHTHMHYHPDAHHSHDHPGHEGESFRHSHEHEHQPLEHSHPHWPDLHHRHEHN